MDPDDGFCLCKMSNPVHSVQFSFLPSVQHSILWQQCYLMFLWLGPGQWKTVGWLTKEECKSHFTHNNDHSPTLTRVFLAKTQLDMRVWTLTCGLSVRATSPWSAFSFKWINTASFNKILHHNIIIICWFPYKIYLHFHFSCMRMWFLGETKK